jgi:hypothetical protein
MLAVRHIWSRGAITGVALMVICAVGLGLAWLGPGGPADRPERARALAHAGDAPRPADYARAPARYDTARRAPAASPDPADTRACGPLPQFPDGTAAQIMAGRLTIAPFKPVVIDPGKDGAIDWAMNPDNDPTWVLDFQTGTWIEALVEAYLAGGQHAASYQARAKAILTGWLASVPLASQNPETLMCSAEAFRGQAWIHDKIPALLDYYAAHWQGAYNHGLSQDLELLRAGCAYPAGDWGGQPWYWRRLARQQMVESFQPNQYGPAVDAQGATNEQATGYANFTFGLWTSAEADLAACHLPPLPATDNARIASMAAFLALATQPDGRLVQIGDTYSITPRDRAGTPLEFAATSGAAGQPPAQRVGVYAAGYIFGRSGWGTRASFGTMSFYSLRFGPGTQIHGHADHMGLTYYARGRDLIVDGGHDGYASDAYRTYLLSPQAASTLVMPDVPFGQNQRIPAPVVTMTRYGSSASILTVIVPAAPGTPVSASAVAHGTGRYLLRIAIGQTSRTLLVSADGAIQAQVGQIDLSRLPAGLGVPGEDQPAGQAERVDEVAEALGRSQGEHQGQADRQPPGRGAQVARRAEHE